MGGQENHSADLQVRHYRLVPIRQEPHQDVPQALGSRPQLGGQMCITRVPRLREFVVVRQRWRRLIVGAAPELKLLFSVLGQRLRFVLALQGAVVTFVEPPGAADWDPVPIADIERDVAGLDGPAQDRSVDDLGQETPLSEQLAAADCLRLSLRAQADVHPACEEIAGVPLTLAVPEKDQAVAHSAPLPPAPE